MNFRSMMLFTRQSLMPFALSPEPVEESKGCAVENRVVRQAHHERYKEFLIAGLRVLICALLGAAHSGLAADAKQPAMPKSTTDSAKKQTNNTKPTNATESETPAAQRGNDQLTLDATLVTGNRELPKVMYIVPWKKADLSNLPGQPFNTLLDEALAPVDREVFRREVDYYEVIADKDRAAADQTNIRQTTPSADKK